MNKIFHQISIHFYTLDSIFELPAIRQYLFWDCAKEQRSHAYTKDFSQALRRYRTEVLNGSDPRGRHFCKNSALSSYNLQLRRSGQYRVLAWHFVKRASVHSKKQCQKFSWFMPDLLKSFFFWSSWINYHFLKQAVNIKGRAPCVVM